MVPHVAARKTHQRLLKFSFVTPKRLFQQYRHLADIAFAAGDVCCWGESGRRNCRFLGLLMTQLGHRGNEE